MKDPDPDHALVEALRSGDPTERDGALGQLYDRHHGRVLNVAWRVTGRRADAEDVVQEVFLGLHRSIAGFRGQATFTSWLYRVTVNRAIDGLRRQARRPAVRMPAGDPRTDASVTVGPKQSPDPVASGAGKDRDRLVRQALDTLSPKLRAVVALRYFEGLSYEELAEVLDCSLGTVKSRIFRAHAALTDALAARGLGSTGLPESEDA